MKKGNVKMLVRNLREIEEKKQCDIHVVVVTYCQCEELSNLNDSIIGIDTCIKCDKPIDRQY